MQEKNRRDERAGNRKEKACIVENIHIYLISKHFYIWRRICHRNFNEKKFVDDYHWIEENEMLDLVAIAQSAPGAIAVNGAIVVGYKLAGMAGTFVAILGTIFPPFMIIILISFFYNFFRDNFFVSQMLEGMQAGVGAVIASVTYDMGKGIVQDKNRESVMIMAGAFVASCICGVNVIYIVLLCSLLGVIQTVIRSRREK